MLPKIWPWDILITSHILSALNFIHTYKNVISILNYVHSRATVLSDIQAIYSMFFKYVSLTENKIYKKDSSGQKLGVNT